MHDKPAIVIFNRDLRLRDNPALVAAAKHNTLIPIYVLEDADDEWAHGGAGRWWLHQSLESLRRDLLDEDSNLYFFKEDLVQTVEQLVAAHGVKAVYWNRVYSEGERERFEKLKSKLAKDEIHAESCNGLLIVEPWDGVKSDGDPYQVYTPYWRNLTKTIRDIKTQNKPSLPKVGCRPKGNIELNELGLMPDISWYKQMEEHWAISEDDASRLLDNFSRSRVEGYN